MELAKYVCGNRGKCAIAVTRRVLRLSAGAPRCPSCRQPLTLVQNSRRGHHLVLIAAGVVGTVLCVTVVVWFWKGGAASLPAPLVSDSAELSLRNDDPSALQPAAVFSDKREVRLTEAALRGDEQGIATALTEGANINAPGREGLTPLLVTLLHFRLAGFTALSNHGADPNLPASNGESVISVAAILPDSAFLRIVLKHGGNRDFRNSQQRTPLILAIQRRRAENVRLLLEHDSDVNAADARGDTPLMHAFQGLTPDIAIIRALLERGARSDTANPAGFTARDYAATFRDPALLSLLFK